MENRIRELRKDRKMTMKQVGDVLGLAESTISQYETGKRQPDNETLLKLGELFDVSVGYILGAVNEKGPTPESGDGLTEQERKFLTLIHRLSEDQKDFLLVQLKTLIEQQK